MDLSLVDVSKRLDLLPQAKEFLRNNVITAFFLCANLEKFGPAEGTSPLSGNYKMVLKGDKVLAVFYHAKSGKVFSKVESSVTDPEERNTIFNMIYGSLNKPDIRGFLGEWESCNPLYQLVLKDNIWKVTINNFKDILMQSDTPQTPEVRMDGTARLVKIDDFEQWKNLLLDCTKEAEVPKSTTDEYWAFFEEAATKKMGWCFVVPNGSQGEKLVAIANVRRIVHGHGLITNVYTDPNFRRKGIARTMLKLIISDLKSMHNVNNVLLYCDPDGTAHPLYQSLGFKDHSEYAIVYGTPASDDDK